jgi:hypothetical protein
MKHAPYTRRTQTSVDLNCAVTRALPQCGALSSPSRVSANTDIQRNSTRGRYQVHTINTSKT